MAEQTVNPWNPMSDPVDKKHIGKLLEELGECTQAAARCLIQGIDEAEPTTGKINREWLEDELADVLANYTLCADRFTLDTSRIGVRAFEKMKQLREWHSHAGVPPAPLEGIFDNVYCSRRETYRRGVCTGWMPITAIKASGEPPFGTYPMLPI